MVATGLMAAAVVGISWGYGVLLGNPDIWVAAPAFPRPATHAVATLEQLSVPTPDSSACDWEQTAFSIDITVDLGRTVHASHLDVSLDSQDSYTLYFFRGDELAGEVQTGSIIVPCQGSGMARFSTELSSELTEGGFDRIAVAGQGDELYCIGELVLTEAE